MTRESAESAVLTSAVLVGSVYAYRRLVEGQGQAAPHVATKTSVKQLAGQGQPPALAHFIVGYGFAFLVMSMMAQADPDLGGGFAILVATSTVIAQGQQLFADVNGQITGTLASAKPGGLAGAVANLPNGTPTEAAPSQTAAAAGTPSSNRPFAGLPPVVPGFLK